MFSREGLTRYLVICQKKSLTVELKGESMGIFHKFKFEWLIQIGFSIFLSGAQAGPTILPLACVAFEIKTMRTIKFL